MKTIKAEVIEDIEQCINEAKSEGRGYLLRADIPDYGYDVAGRGGPSIWGNT